MLPCRATVPACSGGIPGAAPLAAGATTAAPETPGMPGAAAAAAAAACNNEIDTLNQLLYGIRGRSDAMPKMDLDPPLILPNPALRCGSACSGFRL